MASAQSSSSVDTVSTDLQATFRDLVDQWHRDTDHFSSQTQKAMHPGYQRIIGMGPAALPLIFRELEANSGHWFWALRAITGDDPTQPEDDGKIVRMREAWLHYAREHGYLQMSASELERLFPNLRGSRYSVTSEATNAYNCVAWAVGVTDDWWWPEARAYWPVEPRVPTLEGFVSALRTIGYEPCESAEPEAGYEKVAIYVNAIGFATHVARQLVRGEWSSKLGDLEDIAHDLQALEGPPPAYGRVEQILRRPRPVTAPPPADTP